MADQPGKPAASPVDAAVPQAGPGGPTISTHVLDAEQGRPAAGVHVTLYRLGEDDRPVRLTQALTDSDGRIRDLLERPLAPGVYRLEFQLAAQRGSAGPTTTGEDPFFRRVALDLRVDDTARSYHVPLLVAPYAMTTYRGS